MSFHKLTLSFLAGSILLVSSPAWADLSAREYRAATRELDKAVKEVDVGGFLDAFATVLRKNDSRAVRAAVGAYAKISAELVSRKDWSEVYYLHRKAAAAFAGVTGRGALKEIEKQRESQRRDWRGRLLLLDAAAFNEKLSLEESCLAALEDKSPQVIRRALSYLRHSKKVPVVVKMVERYQELEAGTKTGKDRDQIERTLLTFQATLQQMLHVDLPTARDWKNYVDNRKNHEDFFRPPTRKGAGATGLTLFGAAVTGRSIVFILDVSGSMMTTDPLPPGKVGAGAQGRTVVRDPSGRGSGGTKSRVREDRRRITRAKKELSRVIRALPSDVRFNVIAYSSAVYAWEKGMVPSTAANKRKATGFVEELRAEGVTVTDMAIEEAFADLDADTIYLVTDGAPTHVGSSTPGKPPDADAIIAEIHKRVRELNFLRNVRVFTLGFKGAEEDFLKKLSEDHLGRYVAIE